MNKPIDTGGENAIHCSEDARPSRREKRSSHISTPKHVQDQGGLAQLTASLNSCIKAVFLGFSIVTVGAVQASSTPENTTNSIAEIGSGPLVPAVPPAKRPTYRSLLEEPCIIQDATFKKELFSSASPAGARRQFFSLRRSADDYFVNVLENTEGKEAGARAGQFAGVSWEATFSNLTLEDPRINTKPTEVAGLESVTRGTMDLFINLGVNELVRATAVWDRTGTRLVGQSTGGGEIVIEFRGGMEAPSLAAVQHGHTGEEFAYIRYKYDPSFYEGRIPIEFTRFHSGAPTEEVGKVFTVRVHKLELAEKPLPAASLDPRQVFHYKTTYFYSNDLLYWVGVKGQAQKVLTPAEAQRNMPHRPAPISATLVMLILSLVSAPFGMVILIRRAKRGPTLKR